ncbi:hypothetical protein GZH46_00112 [Fragariocoptes setiger]|uniref:Ig-like domain-containing protein n=1 Tax=Fragariocoptes setiger TaxID=1670756 RepID=A0ABQ7SD28_9ACAR|nr:hypothetical protein GZH46_00112 [Fragariocoptes setiger]
MNQMRGINISSKRRRTSLIMRRLLIIATLCVPSMLVRDSQALFNCFSMGSKKLPQISYGTAQTQQYATSGYGMVPASNNWSPYATGYSSSGSMGLFGHKWMSGLGGNKPAFPMAKSWNNWKLGSSGGFYRPGIGYNYGGASNYLPPTAPTYAPLGGWSVPLNVPTNTLAYDHGTSSFGSPTPSVIQATGDPYKPMLSSKWPQDNNYGPTVSPNSGAKGSYGFSYPGWYTGSAESPARIAQRLVKSGIKGSRKGDLTSARLRTQSSDLVLQAEPRFRGFGSAQTVSNREVRLNCAFGESIDPNNKPLWVKFVGEYNATQVVDGKVRPSFNCQTSECRTIDINTSRSHRYSVDDGPSTSTLIIYDPRTTDYGAYRCSALSRPTAPQIPIETLYQVVLFSG